MGNFQLLQLVDSIYLSLSVVLFARVKSLIKHSSEMYWPIWWHMLCIIMEGPQTSELFYITSIHTFYIDVHISLRGSCKTRLNDRELMWNDSNNCSDNNKRTSFFSFSLLSFCSSQMQLGSVTVRSMNWNLVAKIDWHHDVPVTVIRWNKKH